VRVSIGGNGERATLAIRDEGIGMDSDTLAQAFDQFYRSTEARRVAPDGSGIGLYAARGLMEAMGGTLSVSSQLGSGTTVTLNMPAELIEEGVAPAQH
jgi:signal transduction histidine kinase